jgi:glycosyltransferase involved in cell wall biosynthesis
VKITYTSPVRGHQYRYAMELQRMGVLHAHVTGASRFTKAGRFADLNGRIVRRDFWQALHLAGYKFKAPDSLTNALGLLANASIDKAAYQPALESDALLFYRTAGHRTAARLREEGSPCITVMEEVNSHVDRCHELMRDEYEKLGRGKYPYRFADHEIRLEAYEQCDFILCPSAFVERSFLEKGFAREKLIKVNFGFDLSSFGNKPQQQATVDKDVFRLLYVGQLNFRKGIRYAVEAFRRLKHPRKEFILVGPSTKTTGLEGVSLPDGVKLTGILKGEELANAYASATAFVLPTIEEGMALVLGEAMASGLPIVTTTHSGGEDLIGDGVEGYITPPADAEALLQAFEKLASDPEKTKAMGHAARRKASELGDWGVAAAKLVDELKRAKTIKARG